MIWWRLCTQKHDKPLSCCANIASIMDLVRGNPTSLNTLFSLVLLATEINRPHRKPWAWSSKTYVLLVMWPFRSGRCSGSLRQAQHNNWATLHWSNWFLGTWISFTQSIAGGCARRHNHGQFWPPRNEHGAPIKMCVLNSHTTVYILSCMLGKELRRLVIGSLIGLILGIIGSTGNNNIEGSNHAREDSNHSIMPCIVLYVCRNKFIMVILLVQNL